MGAHHASPQMGREELREEEGSRGLTHTMGKQWDRYHLCGNRAQAAGTMNRRLWDREELSVSVGHISSFLSPRCCSHSRTPTNWGKPRLKGKQLCSLLLEVRSLSKRPSEPQVLKAQDTYKPPQSSTCRGPWRTRIRCKGRARSESLASPQALLTGWGDFSPQWG